ncbi:hypothetical protein BJ508DRAFT_320780 [Ascobolus immersus RN42]|uniref:Uncharacterized protein n=1 Tax=Ascobolus immersus RN42 TaxID=1160509 RepID=A0A3N4IQU2_ASCIM|nr:hypothetical protein BJ508DRAFT_320780 [Ascobolus immersus RN42]
MDLFKKNPKPLKRNTTSTPPPSQYQSSSLQHFPSAPPRFTNPFRSKTGRNQDRSLSSSSVIPTPPIETDNPIPSFPIESVPDEYIDSSQERVPDQQEQEYGPDEGDYTAVQETTSVMAKEELAIKPTLCFSNSWTCEPFGQVDRCDNLGCGLPQIGHSKCGLCGKDFCLRCWEKKVDAVH